jgi:hypothetical protein
VARTHAALLAGAVAILAALTISGGSSSDPRTPAALPGLPPPFLTTGVLGEGGLTAGIDSYGDIVDLRDPGPAGRPLIENPVSRQRAGTVPADTGIVPRASIRGGPARPFWRADAVRQRYAPGTNVLLTTARFGGGRVRVACAAAGGELGCVSGGRANGRETGGRDTRVRVTFQRDLEGGEDHVHLDDPAARRIVADAARADRRWLAPARRLGARAPAWARRLYRRSLLVLHALTGRNGAVAAGARDGWAYVWPRDAGAVAIAFAAAGYPREARGVAGFLRRADLDAAARFFGDGEPVPGRPAQGDAWGWAAAAARAAALPPREWMALERKARESWRNRPDYQEKSPGDYLGNALAARSPEMRRFSHRLGEKNAAPGLEREAGDPGSGIDSAAAWAVRPFPQPRLFPAVRRTLAGLERAQRRRLGRGALRFGLVPSDDWPDAAPWTAPTAWSAWSLATLTGQDRSPKLARRDRADALALLRDLHRDETPAGLLPERVGARTGTPISTAPLAWSHAFAILALRRLWPAG